MTIESSRPDGTLASPHSLVSHYFQFARRAADTVASEPFESDRCTHVAVIVIMVVGAVEAYLNALGRLWVEQDADFVHADRIRKDLENRVPFGKKLKTWPELLFGRRMEYGSGVPQEFLQLVELRNHLMHFTTTYDHVSYDNVTIKGLTDMTRFYSLVPEDGKSAVDLAECMIFELIRLQGLSEEHVLLAGTRWTGRPAFPEELEVARARDIQEPRDCDPKGAT